MSLALLSIDGGGMKAIISAVVLEKMENLLQTYSGNPQARLGDYFDFIAGTSSGSILTSLYLCPKDNHPKYSAKEILDLYLTLGSSIFVKQSLYPLFGPKYISQDFQEVLYKYFGDLRISQLLKSCLITSYDTTKRKAEFFTKETGEKYPDRNPYVVEAVRASCSAPTYFPPVCLSTSAACSSCYVDGGIVANDPSLCAVIELLKENPQRTVQDIHIFSIGNIKTDTPYICKDVKKWGLLEWAVPLFTTLLNSSTQIVPYQLGQLYHIIGKENQYIRLQINSTDKSPAMDDYSEEAIQFFISTGETLYEKNQDVIKDFVKWLIKKDE